MIRYICTMDVEVNNFKRIKYAGMAYNVIVDEKGLPSKIMVNGKICSLNSSIDRHHFRSYMITDLIENHFFSRDEANKISEVFCEEKYNQYKKEVMKL